MCFIVLHALLCCWASSLSSLLCKCFMVSSCVFLLQHIHKTGHDTTLCYITVMMLEKQESLALHGCLKFALSADNVVILHSAKSIADLDKLKKNVNVQIDVLNCSNNLLHVQQACRLLQIPTASQQRGTSALNDNMLIWKLSSNRALFEDIQGQVDQTTINNMIQHAEQINSKIENNFFLQKTMESTSVVGTAEEEEKCDAEASGVPGKDCLTQKSATPDTHKDVAAIFCLKQRTSSDMSYGVVLFDDEQQSSIQNTQVKLRVYLLNSEALETFVSTVQNQCDFKMHGSFTNTQTKVN